MGDPITFPQLLVLSAFGIVFVACVASATNNTTQGFLTPGISSTSQESCPGDVLLDVSRSVFAAVDSLVGELSCKRKENGSQTEDSFMEVEQNIRRIVNSSIKVFSDLGTNLSGFDVLEQIGILDSLSVDDYNDPAFIRLWFSLKMTFLLPFVTDRFLFQLGNRNFSCTSFQELVKSLSEGLEASQTTERKQIYSNFIRVYLTRKNTAEPGCTENVAGIEEWLEKNIRSFLVFARLQDLKTMNRNFSGSEVVEKLSPQQRAELILDPDSGVLDNADFVRIIIKNLTMFGDDEQLDQFFQMFSLLSKETNTTYIQNVAVRETILNLTLSSLALKFDNFEVQDYQLWFQVYLIPVIASIQPDSLRVIPGNISCEAYGAIVTGLMESLKILPPQISMDVRSSLESLQEAFPDCATLDSFTCKDTHVDDSSQLHALEDDNSTEAVCNFTITEHACAPTRRLSAENLATLLKCSLESNRMYVVEVWQLLFQKASPVLRQALASFSATAQLKSEDFVRSWFQMDLGPFLASPSTNFLFCLGTYNFSCQTYQIVIGAFSNQSPLMDNDRKRAVFTHFIQPFLSRKDLPDPGCVSSANSSQLWLQANFGNFSQFASVEDLQALYPNFSSAEVLSKLSPSQVAEFLLSTDISNDTRLVDRVFERLQVGNAVENVDAFFTKLTEKEVPEFQVDVRDRIMNRTYIIVGPSFPEFPEKDLFDWFHVKLVPVLPSFTPQMLQDVITNINCTKYHVIVSGMGKVCLAVAQERQEEIAAVLLQYLKNSADVINRPACRVNIQTDSQWVETNLGPFSQYATYFELKFFNLSQGALVSVLSPKQKAELLTDPGSNALEDATLVKEVLTNLTEPGNVEQLGQFFLVFTQSLQQTNTTYIQNVAVRETILNLTLSSLALKFDDFEVQDYQLWFQVYLIPVIASIQPDSLRVIPGNISCEAYGAIVTGLMESLKILPPQISMDVRSSLESLQEAFPDCATLDSFTCKDTHVDEKLICSEVDSSQLHALEDDNSTEAVCNFTITEHACAPTRRLSAENLATLLKCSLESNRMYVVEVWQLLFQKASPVLRQALASFSATAPTAMSAAYSNPLDALREVVAKNLTQAQLKSEDFVRSWFQMDLGPFLASPSTNFLFCLGTYNFSCQTYQIVIGAFSNQSPLMDNDRKRAVFTHFIQPFLSRKDLPDPGCVSSANSSQLWLQANFGNFSQFASVEDLQALYPNFSSAEVLSKLSPSQVAEFLLSTDISNDTRLVDRVFERLQVGNAVENVDAFFTKLTEKEVPEFQVDVRDRIMNRTYIIVGPSFPEFPEKDLFDWFHVKLVPVLPSFTPQMLQDVITNINCTKYHVIVSGMGKVVSAVAQERQEEIAAVLLQYLKNSADVINRPACRVNIQTDSQWVETNLGPFSQYATYFELKFFNLSQGALVSVLSPKQKAELLTDPGSNALEDATLVKEVLTNLTEPGNVEQLGQFFLVFTQSLQQTNTTYIQNVAVRETILNLTLSSLALKFDDFEVQDYQLWFQVYLIPVIASIQPDSLRVIPGNISCEAYGAIVTGLMESLKILPPQISMDVRSSLESLQEAFPDCATLDSFTCKDTHVDEKLICSEVDSSQLQALEDDNSTEAVCNFTITEHACAPTRRLSAENLATLLKCSLESNRMYVVEVWQLLFQKASPVLRQALASFSATAPTAMSAAYSNPLDALREVVAKNLTQAQLKSEDFVRSWFQMDLGPFLASPSTNFLFCLGTYNFSCQTYQIVIGAFSNQSPLMDNDRKRAVFTHFIQPFLSRKDLPDPGCVSSANSSQLWLQANFGNFSQFASVEDLQALYPNFSSAEVLSKLSPSQVAEFLLSTDISNDTRLVDRVFERLQVGNAVENVDAFFTKLTEKEVPEFQVDVRDRIMNRTYIIVGPSFPEFPEKDLFDWFHVKLVPVLPSFTPQMLQDVITNINCTKYHVIVSGMGKVVSAVAQERQEEIAAVLLQYLKNSADVINRPACRVNIQTDSNDLRERAGTGALVSVLSPKQKAELLTDPGSNALEDATLVKEVLTNLTEPGNVEQLGQFFLVFTQSLQQTNTTYIQNVAVRETILNLTLSSLALKFDDFESHWPNGKPEDPATANFNGREVKPGITAGGLPSCCFVCPQCKDTHVDEKLICSEVDSSQLQALEDDNSTEAVCNFTITEHACAPTRRLSAENLATLLKCSLESNRMYVVEVWQLLFQKASPVLRQALASFSATAPTAMSAAYSNPLDALREVVAKNLTQAQLKSEDFVRSWFQMDLGPFLASPSTNFLFCLGTYNFSCQTYQIVIGAFSNQSPLMDNDRKRAVFTHFIQPFLSRKDLPDPGCVSSANSSQLWLQANFGNFSQFASVEDLQALYPNFSSAEVLSKLSPSQVAEFLLSTDISNDTRLVDRVFERLQVGNAVENVDAFFTKLTEKEVPEFQVDVRDRIMNRTYIIVGPSFPEFPEKDLFDWFHVKLVPVLPSFTPQMLQDVITNINCTKYHVIVSGMGKVVSAVAQERQEEIAAVLLQYLKNSADVINRPACRVNIQTDSQWVETNLGPFSQYATYFELKFFNLSQGALVSVLSPKKKAELLTDPGSNALEDATLVKEVLTNLTEPGNVEQLGQFFLVFTQSLQQTNTTYIQNVAVRETILNLTLSSLALKFDDFEVQDYQLWFQVYLIPVIASIQPDSLRVIPGNISCEAYGAIVTGLMESLKILPPQISMDVRSSLESLQEAFPDCATLDSFTCKDTHVDEKLICSEVDSSQLHALEDDNSTEAVCNFTITEHACAPTRRLSAENLATLLKCSLESNRMYVVEVWQLLFQKASPVLRQALASFSATAPTAMSAAYSNPLDALREVVAKNLTQAQLKSEDFVRSWFQMDLGPFLASPSTNFLFCLGTYNFSCQTYQIVIGAFSNQSPLMDNDRKRAVFTHFIQPFLSRKDLPDPGCVSSANSSQLWLQANFGNFSQFASVEDLQALYPNFSILSKLSPSQVAEFLLSTDISNDTRLVDRVFERLQVGNAVENVDAFFTKLTEKEVPEFQVDVRDRIMNRTYIIVGPSFPEFPEKDLFDWFHVKLVPVLPSFTPQMLQDVITNINCTKYHVM
ncbi:uncharacterized protein LOC129374649 [Poeciliopsis prolifica]|uniref:uncharacterized protein LOC129374649 n=1 Tax=Poeciliopsis prolifica TaxID=188132 RepID=UPI002413B122|nr:uncharacterized protein LOC129374649 [Poeciliopsis prolifica]